MMDLTIKPINSITVVGGGSAGWLTAAILSNSDPNLQITIIDKEVPQRIGVGEATTLEFPAAMKQAGFEVSDWFDRIDATIKVGIHFPDWNEKDIWHPFSTNIFYDNRLKELPVSSIDVWSNYQTFDFKQYGLKYYNMCVEENSVNKQDDGIAYHIDAVKLALFLEEELKKRSNVNSINSTVVNILRDENNNITSLELANGTSQQSDLYIDCTGFARLLAKDPEVINMQGRLFCDTAIACRVNYEDKDNEMTPYVRCEQVDHGWIWTIPTQSRMGSGLVFNRSITDVDQAKQYLINYWSDRITEDELKVIDWTPQYVRNPWQNNVVAIGLSAGFIEPLESTGLALIALGVQTLCNNIIGHYYQADIRNKYNSSMTSYFENCIDFVSMHYCNSTKDTPFWDYVRSTYVESQKQKYYKDKFSSGAKLNYNGSFNDIFAETNWALWMIQLGFEYKPKECGSKEWLYKNMIACSLDMDKEKIPHVLAVQNKNNC